MNDEGFTLFYMAVFLGPVIFVGLAVDTGRAYVVQAQLSKAVDGAALGAARMLNSGDPREEAATIYRANFPAGWFGTSSSTTDDVRLLPDETVTDDRRQHRHVSRDGGRADDLHEAGELPAR